MFIQVHTCHIHTHSHLFPSSGLLQQVRRECHMFYIYVKHLKSADCDLYIATSEFMNDNEAAAFCCCVYLR